MILIKRRSVVLTMPHRKLKAVGKAHAYRYGNSSPRYSVRTTMPSLYPMKVSYVFNFQDKHNASLYSNMSWKWHTPNPCQNYKKFRK